jgi:hypothetical protein
VEPCNQRDDVPETAADGQDPDNTGACNEHERARQHRVEPCNQRDDVPETAADGQDPRSAGARSDR